MRIRAAILWERGQPLSVEEAELDPPGPGEVLVEVKAAGVCHSDLHPARDDWPTRTPLTLGHEGAGIVLETGAGVTQVKAGDHVVFCWAPACGICPSCAEGRAVLCDRLDRTTYRNRLPSGAVRLHARGQDIAHFLSTACFASHAVVAEEGAVVVGREGVMGGEAAGNIPFDALATLGCAVVTGVGAVLAAAKVPPGATIAFIGAGGVGLNVAQGAVIAGCERIIAIDRHRVPLEIARRFGATDVVEIQAADGPPNGGPHGREGSPRSGRQQGGSAEGGSHMIEVHMSLVDQVKSLTGGRGADFVFDTVGAPATLADAMAATRKGGTVILTGLSRVDGVGNVQMFPLVMQEKKLIGSVYGSGRPAEDIARLANWYLQGRLKLRELVSRTYRLAEINEALGALGASAGARGIILPER
jgi:S-(hydroxymethyl)glutathione dehydrogenase/alcohol dehydrogenase